MIANLQNPIAAVRGALSLGSRYYARMLNGKCVIQRKPNRSNHVPTQEETDNRHRFIERYRKTRVGHESASRPSRDHHHTSSNHSKL